MSTVMNMIVSMKELESELSVQDKQMASLKVDDLETVKQVKGRLCVKLLSFGFYTCANLNTLSFEIPFNLFVCIVS